MQNKARRPPLHLCALTLSPHVSPVATPDGLIFDAPTLVQLIRRTDLNPLTGAPVRESDLTPLRFSRATPSGLLQCPVRRVPFTPSDKVLALPGSGLVVSASALLSPALSMFVTPPCNKNGALLVLFDPELHVVYPRPLPPVRCVAATGVVRLCPPPAMEPPLVLPALVLPAPKNPPAQPSTRALPPLVRACSPPRKKPRLPPPHVAHAIIAPSALPLSSSSSLPAASSLLPATVLAPPREPLLVPQPRSTSCAAPQLVPEPEPEQRPSPQQLKALQLDTLQRPPPTHAPKPASAPVLPMHAAPPAPPPPAMDSRGGKSVEDERDRKAVYKRIRKGRKGKGYVRIVTNIGHLNMELHCDKAPMTSDNFLQLAERRFYDGLLWHRVVPGFIAQTGDPTGSGDCGESAWGGFVKDEIRTSLNHDSPGVVSMANQGGRDTNRSQWFICFDAAPHLDGAHTVFGKVVGGLYVLKQMESEAAMGHPLTVERVEVLVNPIRQVREQMRTEINAQRAGPIPRPLPACVLPPTAIMPASTTGAMCKGSSQTSTRTSVPSSSNSPALSGFPPCASKSVKHVPSSQR